MGGGGRGGRGGGVENIFWVEVWVAKDAALSITIDYWDIYGIFVTIEHEHSLYGTSTKCCWYGVWSFRNQRYLNLLRYTKCNRLMGASYSWCLNADYLMEKYYERDCSLNKQITLKSLIPFSFSFKISLMIM